MAERGYADVDHMPPDEFVTWVFPRLFRSRLPRYEQIARQWGYAVDAGDLMAVQSEGEFVQLIVDALAG